MPDEPKEYDDTPERDEDYEYGIQQQRQLDDAS